MPANRTFRSATSSDAKVLKAFEEIGKELNQNMAMCTVTVTVATNSAQVPPFTLIAPDRNPFVQFANQHGEASWDVFRIEFEEMDLNVRLSRKPEEGDDEIIISFNQDPEDPLEISRAFTAIQRHFVPLNRAAAIERVLGPELAEFYRRREEGLARLESLAQKIVTETHTYRLRLDSETADHKRALTASLDEKEKNLEEKFDERTGELDAREEELNKQRQELDDRSARHARREQSRELQEKIANRSKKFTLTTETRRKRWPVHGIFVVLLVLTGGLISRSLFVPATATQGVALWLEFGRFPLGMVGFALTAIFYIRWTDHWFRQHADQEFKLQQLALDVDRAGYATEMLLEWQEDKGGEMPAVMVDRLTAGLFTDQNSVGQVRHPSEDIASSLLKAASNVRIDVPGIGELTLSGRQIKKLDRNMTKERDG